MSDSKVFIITGASKGIGAAVALQLIADSHKVVLAARSEKLLGQIKSSYPGQVEYVAGDMTDEKVCIESHNDVASVLTPLFSLDLHEARGSSCAEVWPPRWHGYKPRHSREQTRRRHIVRIHEANIRRQRLQLCCYGMKIQSTEKPILLTGIRPQAQAGLKEIKKTKGCIVWVSSGASIKAYQAWGAYGSSKAAMNAFCAHIALEEPDITSVAIGPGRVDTDMQALVRSTGKDTMQPEVYQTFVDGYEAGELLKPAQPGGVIARLVATPLKEVSGQYLRQEILRHILCSHKTNMLQLERPGLGSVPRLKRPIEVEGSYNYRALAIGLGLYKWQFWKVKGGNAISRKMKSSYFAPHSVLRY